MNEHQSVTLLFTDIEGSTRRWEQQRAAMAAALTRHDTILRSAIEDAGGEVFKTVGDAFCAVFESAPNAIRSALAAQHRLLAEDWSAFGPDFGALRVRMAVHAGSPETRDGDYFGPDVNRVARLMAAGHGGQVLVSGAAAALVADQLPAGLQLRDLGERRLKDLREPGHIFQLVAPGLGADFPPLATLDARPNNLPLQLTGLVGREAELQELARMLRVEAGPRLITLTGPGGTGKTRLALQSAADLLDDFDHGVWWVDLSPLTDPGLVAPSIAKALGVDEVPGAPIEELLSAWLSKRSLLLVLDNHEQLLPAAPLVSRLLAEAPRMRVLVTSREPLRLRGERTFAVETLALPVAGGDDSATALVQFAAVRLFIDRALSVRPDFAIDERSAPIVAEICTRLDGLPLAIELAAARVNVLSPAQLLARLTSRLRILTRGATDMPQRQQTMRNAIAWSYDLLDAPEQRLFRWLSVFVGGWTLEAAEAVAGDGPGISPPPDSPGDTQPRTVRQEPRQTERNAEAVGTSPRGSLGIDLLDGLTSLVQKSLIQPVSDEVGDRRFKMLETIREFGLEQLGANGEIEFLTADHALYYLRLANQHDDEETYGPDWSEHWAMLLQVDLDNHRAALNWAVIRDTALGLQILARIMMPIDEKLTWLSRLSSNLESAPAEARAAANDVAAHHAFALGNFIQAEMGFRLAALQFAEAGDLTRRAVALFWVAWSCFQQGKLDEFEDLISVTSEAAVVVNRRSLQVGVLGQRWELALARGQHDIVIPLIRETQSKALALGLPPIPVDAALIMWVAYAAGDMDAADANVIGYLKELREADISPNSWVLDTIGRIHLARGRSAQAAGAFLTGLRIARDAKWLLRETISWHIDGLAGAARRQGEPATSAMLRAAAAAWRAAGGKAIPPAEQREHDSEIASLNAELGEQEFQRSWDKGMAMSPDEALSLAEATVTTARYDDPTDIPTQSIS